MHSLKRGYFWSCDEDGGHTIQSAIAKKPMIDANLMAVCFVEPGLWPLEVLLVGTRIFNFFFAPVILTLTE